VRQSREYKAVTGSRRRVATIETSWPAAWHAGRILAYHVCGWLHKTSDLLLDRGMMGDGVMDLPAERSCGELGDTRAENRDLFG